MAGNGMVWGVITVAFGFAFGLWRVWKRARRAEQRELDAYKRGRHDGMVQLAVEEYREAVGK